MTAPQTPNAAQRRPDRRPGSNFSAARARGVDAYRPPRRCKRLTTEWFIDLDESSVSRLVDGDLQLVSPGPLLRTVWLAVWGPPEDESVEGLLARIREDVNPDPVQRFKEPGADSDEGRYASWYPEPTDDGGQQWGL